MIESWHDAVESMIQSESDANDRPRCRWGGCGEPAAFEFRCIVAEDERCMVEHYCDACARLARQCYCATIPGGVWPDPEVPATVVNLPTTYDWIKRIEVVRLDPHPVGSEPAISVEVMCHALAGAA